MAKAKIVLKNKMKTGEYRVYLRISHLNQPAKYLKLTLKAKPNEWRNENQRFKRNKLHFKELNEALKEIETLSESIITKLEINNCYSYEAFVKYFHQNGNDETQTVNDVFIENRSSSFLVDQICRQTQQ